MHIYVRRRICTTKKRQEKVIESDVRGAVLDKVVSKGLSDQTID